MLCRAAPSLVRRVAQQRRSHLCAYAWLLQRGAIAGARAPQTLWTVEFQSIHLVTLGRRRGALHAGELVGEAVVLDLLLLHLLLHRVCQQERTDLDVVTSRGVLARKLLLSVDEIKHESVRARKDTG